MCMHPCMNVRYVTCVLDTGGGQKRALCSLKLELEAALSCHVSAGN